METTLSKISPKTTAGAAANTMVYSLIETAKKNQLNSFDYLSKILDKLPPVKTVKDYEKLLPLKDLFRV